MENITQFNPDLVEKLRKGEVVIKWNQQGSSHKHYRDFKVLIKHVFGRMINGTHTYYGYSQVSGCLRCRNTFELYNNAHDIRSIEDFLVPVVPEFPLTW